MEQIIEQFRAERHARGMSPGTARNLETHLGRISEYFKNKPCWTDISALSAENEETFRDELLGEGRTPTYVLAILGDLRAIKAFASRKDPIPAEAPVPVVVHDRRAEPGKQVSLRALVAILMHLPTQWWMAVVTMRFCGFRVAETLRVRIRDIDFDSLTMSVAGSPERGFEGLVGSPAHLAIRRTVPIPPMLVPLIRWWIDNRVADRVTGTVNPDSFLCWSGGSTEGCVSRLCAAWIRAVWASAVGGRTEQGSIQIRLSALRYSHERDLLTDPAIPAALITDILGPKQGRSDSGGTSERHFSTRHLDESGDALALAERVGNAIIANSEVGDIVPKLIDLLAKDAQSTPMRKEETMSVTEASTVLGISDARVRRLLEIKEMSFDTVRRGQRHFFLIPVGEVQAYAARTR